MNKGTREGDRAEEDFVVDFNSGVFSTFNDTYFSGIANLRAVRVTSHQFSSLSNGYVKPKADAFLISTDFQGGRADSGRGQLLTEDDLSEFPHRIIANSGISIKHPDSEKYQIHKFTRASFLAVFGDPFLGAGALVYIKNDSKIAENKEILKGWGLSVREFRRELSERTQTPLHQIANDYKLIQRHCLAEIKRQILSDQTKLDVVFFGQTTFKSPYFAKYSYIKRVLGIATASDFNVTQGSDRLNDPTIVVKPR